MYLMKLVLNSDATYMIICFDVGADVHHFSVLKYRRSENENTHLSVKLQFVWGTVMNNMTCFCKIKFFKLNV